MILQANNIHKSYKTEADVLHVLKAIDLKVEAGEFVSIVGPSGAGKSTLLHALGGLQSPDEGQVTLDGQDIYELDDAARAKLRNQRMGFVFQFYHLLPEFTALENVILPVLIRDDQRKNKEVEQKGLSILKLVGLEKRSQHKPNQLSGGEQQRVAIARALINQPQIIFCDEPTGNLDSERGQEIIELLMDLNKRNNQSFVIVTHEQSIAQISHRTIHMRDGQINENAVHRD